MKKGIMFLSAGLTGFILAALAGVIYTHTVLAFTQPISQSSAPTSGSSLVSQMDPGTASVSNVSPQDAAALAAKGINRTDLYSVQLADFQGGQVYKVAFSSGSVVYVSQTGQLLSFVVPTATVTTPPSPSSLYPAPIQLGAHKHSASGHGGGGEGGGGDK